MSAPQFPLRIGFVSMEYPGFGPYGGIGVYVQQVAHCLKDLGHLPFVLLSNGAPTSLHEDGGIPIHSFNPVTHFPFPIGRGSSLMMAKRLSRLVRELKLNILEVPEFGGAAGALSLWPGCSIPTVVRLHTCSAIVRSLNHIRTQSYGRSLTNSLGDRMERRGIQKAQMVTAISAAVVEETKFRLRISRRDIKIVANPVSDSFFNVHSNHEDAAPIVLFLGRLEWRKGPDILVESLSLLLPTYPGLQLWLAGADTNTDPRGASMRGYLEGLIDPKNRNNFKFLGALDHSEVLRVIGRATVCVFPSRWEGFGIACAETMAACKPVVAPDTSCFPEFIRHGENGLLARENSPAALAAEIGLLLSSQALRDNLAAGARRYALAHFECRKVCTELLDVYHAVAQRCPNRKQIRVALGVRRPEPVPVKENRVGNL